MNELRRVLPVLALILSSCSTSVLLPETELFDPCRAACNELSSQIEIPEACLILRPGVLDELNEIDARIYEYIERTDIPTGACACFIATVDLAGRISNVEVVETNLQEVSSRVADGIRKLPPTGTEADCLEGARIPVLYPFD